MKHILTVLLALMLYGVQAQKISALPTVLPVKGNSIKVLVGDASNVSSKINLDALMDTVTLFKQSSITVYLEAGKTFGKYANGSTISTAGKTAVQVILDALTEAVAPTYVQPTVTISSTNAADNYEIGSALNSTLSSTFTQNNAGALSSTVYQKNGSNLGSNTDNIASLTSVACYQVIKTYAQGSCLNNNLGQQDCTGRVNAGSISSATLCLTPLPKKYWGFTSVSSPTDANIRALSQQLSATLSTLTASFGAQSATYLVYAYPASFADLTSIVVNGFPSLGAFTKTTRAFVNAQGYSQSYKIYVSNNAFTTSSTTDVTAQ